MKIMKKEYYSKPFFRAKYSAITDFQTILVRFNEFIQNFRTCQLEKFLFLKFIANYDKSEIDSSRQRNCSSCSRMIQDIRISELVFLDLLFSIRKRSSTNYISNIYMQP